MYSFLFDRKSLILLVAGLATAGGLLFVSGLLVGVVWGVPGAAAPPPAAPVIRPVAVSLAKPCPPQAEPEAQPAESDAPAEQWADLDQEEKASGSSAGERSAAPADPVASEASVLPGRGDGMSGLAGADRTTPAGAPAGANEAPSVGPLAQAAPPSSYLEDSTGRAPEPGKPAPEAAAPATQTQPVAASDARFSLQVGAYRQAENSSRAVQELQRLGYDAYVVAEGGRGTLRTVRIGRYADMADAERAAAEFRRREGRAAIVRTQGS